ncbi:YbaY family lipoprotein [Primorskyibacter sp. S87]|uniref:YbaY family lipoprotein n=1 Tax=Primorskyibacter sp. S87 TaxID=3415126 RepID=UPI003C7C63F9
MAGTVSGTVTYLERIAVPPGAVLEVQLQDVSRADAPSVTLASQRWALSGVPIPFSLTYDDALIDERMRYNVQAAIWVGDERRYLTTSAYPVLTHDAPAQVDVVVDRISKSAATTLENSGWRVTEIGGKPIEGEQPSEIHFAEGGAFGALGGCNRFRGKAEISAGALSFPDNMAGTLMACPPPLDEQEQTFLKVLGDVAGYQRDGSNLQLLNAEGETVLRLILLP